MTEYIRTSATARPCAGKGVATVATVAVVVVAARPARGPAARRVS